MSTLVGVPADASEGWGRMTRPDLTDLRERARTWFEALRDRVCAAFEQLEGDYRGPESERLAPGRSRAGRGTGPRAAAA